MEECEVEVRGRREQRSLNLRVPVKMIGASQLTVTLLQLPPSVRKDAFWPPVIGRFRDPPPEPKIKCPFFYQENAPESTEATSNTFRMTISKKEPRFSRDL